LAANKRKILEAARKHAQKGAKEKALKEFGKLLKLDPRDSKVRLEVGDTYRRWGQVTEAIEAYSVVADQFMQEGFDARAVAVFKQIQNLQPDTFAHYEPLAELYQRMGLTAEAIGCLESAAEAFREAGQKQEALGLLRKMAAIDPSNTTSRIKVADLLQQEGMKEDAITEYEAVITELELQGDSEGVAKLFERIIEIQPERVQTLALYARNLIDRGSAQRAESLAKRALELDRSPEHYELLADAYRIQHREEDLIALYRELAELYRERGDEERTREILQRYVPLEEIGSTDTPNGYIDESERLEHENDLLDDLSIGDETTLLDGDLLSDSSLLVSDDDSGFGTLGNDDLNGIGSDSLDLISDSNEMTCLLPEEPAGGAASEGPDGGAEEIDVGQLLAEASVYLRYGKQSQAIANLESILEREPEHRLALEKLGEALAEGDDSAKAVEMWSRAAKSAAQSGEAEAAEVLRSRIATLDPAAAEALDLSFAGGAAADPDSGESPIADDLLGGADDGDIDETDDDLSLSGDLDDATADDAPADIEGADLPELDLAEVSISELEIEIDVDDASFTQPPSDDDLLSESDLEPPSETGAREPVEEEADLPARADAADSSIEASSIGDSDSDAMGIGESASGGDEAMGEFAEGGESEALTAAKSPVGEVTPEKVAEDLEEADFYMEQGLYDEAEAVYSRILSIVPNHPHAMVRLGELASHRGDAPGSLAGSADPVVDSSSDADDVADKSPDGEIGADLADWQGDFPDDESEADDSSEEIDIDTLEEESQREMSLAELESVATSDGSERPDEVGVDGDAALAESDLAADLGLGDSAEFSLDSELDSADSSGEVERDETGELPSISASPGEAEVTEPLTETERPIEAPVEIPVETQGSELAGGEDAGASAEAEADAGDGEEDFGFDLAAELSQSFDRDPGASSGALGSSGSSDTSEDGFAAVFAEFKKGVSETLNEGDHQAHYDLGIAYREMGLLNDALTEFRLAMNSPERRVGCLHLMGLCAHEMGEAEQAVGHFAEALACDGISQDTLLAIKLDLGRVHESIGDVASARCAYEEIRAINSSFGDVEARLDELAKVEEVEAKGESGTDTEEYESFSEFLGDFDEPDPDAEEASAEPAQEAGEDEEAEAPPAWESFEDVVVELEDSDVVEMPSDAVVTTEPLSIEDLEPGEPAAETETNPKRKKKKISFV